MIRVLHFADAHIDMANYGRHDPQSGLPVRVLDFLKSLDEITETAIKEKVDLVIFAGDAYKDRSPAPTFQREWGKRIMRLSQAGIPTILLVGNHDLSPAIGRAHAIQEFETLNVPHVRVIAQPQLLGPSDLDGLPVQVIGLPWVSRSGLMAALGTDGDDSAEIYTELETRLTQLFESYLEKADPSLPLILTAHASVQGALYGGERMVMLGNDLVLSGSLVKNPRLDYVALGHIHKPQNLNGPGPLRGDKTAYGHPPVIYPGSIERVDFGEAADDKFFVIAEVEKGQTSVSWRKLSGVRPFVDKFVRVASGENLTERLIAALPEADQLSGAIARLVIEYPRDLEKLLDEAALRDHAKSALEFHLVKRPQIDARVRLAADQSIAALTPLELLETYWKSLHLSEAEMEQLQALARAVLSDSGPEY
ncbi:MAG: exonuclease SbcCD subunit D [Anaerolineales bacterium]|nr:exonuclease SbcCD subunit D [Anaerolineales bacterium]